MTSESGYIAPEATNSHWSDITLLQQRSRNRLYRAKRYGRWFVLKTLTKECEDLTELQQLQEREFELGVQLVHPHIAATYSLEHVHDIGRCIVQEDIDGETLTRWLQTKPAFKARRRALLQLLDAISYLHSQQLVHHDLKGDNILITHNGQNLKLIDFGLGLRDDLSVAIPNDVRADLQRIGDILQLLHLRRYRRVRRRLQNNHYHNCCEVVDDLRRCDRRLLWLLVALIITLLSACAFTLHYAHRLSRNAQIEIERSQQQQHQISLQQDSLHQAQDSLQQAQQRLHQAQDKLSQGQAVLHQEQEQLRQEQASLETRQAAEQAQKKAAAAEREALLQQTNRVLQKEIDKLKQVQKQATTRRDLIRMVGEKALETHQIRDQYIATLPESYRSEMYSIWDQRYTEAYNQAISHAKNLP